VSRALFFALCLLPLFAGGARAQELGLDAAIRLVGEGNFQAALVSARGETRSLERSQALLHVLHHAGALEEALQAGRAGLERHPGDEWLLDRCAYLALSLGAGNLGRELSSRLGENAEPGSWQETNSSWMLGEIELLEENRGNQRRALSRSRWTVGLAALACIVLALCLLLRPCPGEDK